MAVGMEGLKQYDGNKLPNMGTSMFTAVLCFLCLNYVQDLPVAVTLFDPH